MKLTAMLTWVGVLVGFFVPAFSMVVCAAVGFAIGTIIFIGSDPKR